MEATMRSAFTVSMISSDSESSIRPRITFWNCIWKPWKRKFRMNWEFENSSLKLDDTPWSSLREHVQMMSFTLWLDIEKSNTHEHFSAVIWCNWVCILHMCQCHSIYVQCIVSSYDRMLYMSSMFNHFGILQYLHAPACTWRDMPAKPAHCFIELWCDYLLGGMMADMLVVKHLGRMNECVHLVLVYYAYVSMSLWGRVLEKCWEYAMNAACFNEVSFHWTCSWTELL